MGENREGDVLVVTERVFGQYAPIRDNCGFCKHDVENLSSLTPDESGGRALVCQDKVQAGREV